MKTLLAIFALTLSLTVNAIAANAPAKPLLKPGRYILISSSSVAIFGKGSVIPTNPFIVNVSQKGKETLLQLEDDPKSAPVVVKSAGSSVVFSLVVKTKHKNGDITTRYYTCEGSRFGQSGMGWRGSMALLVSLGMNDLGGG